MRIEFDRNAFDKILRSSELEAVVTQAAQDVAEKASDFTPQRRNYVASVIQGKSRVRGIVYPDDYEAMGSNRKHNTLLKVLGGK